MENVKLDLIPGRVMPICHASQYDVGRVIRFNLVENDVPYVLDGTETVTFGERKIDGNVVTAACVVTATKSYVDLETTEQMCACYGQNLCELKIEKGDVLIGTLNFVLDVERDPLDGGIQSESEIYNLQVQIDEIIQQELENYDIYGAYVTEQISGAVASFTDGADDVPVKALSVEFAATQASGTPTPSAPIPITPVNSVKVTRTGKNLCSLFTDGKVPSITTGELVNAGGGRTDYIKALPNTFYTFSVSGDSQSIYMFFYDEKKGFLSYQSTSGLTLSKQTPANCSFIMLRTSKNASETPTPQLELGSTATAYEAYNGVTKTLDLGDDYYGGEVDKDGNINENYGYIEYDGSDDEPWTAYATSTYYGFQISNWAFLGNNAGGMCNRFKVQANYSETGVRLGATAGGNHVFYFIHITDSISGVTDVATWRTWLANNPVTVKYPLETPATAQASNAIDFNTLLGDNNFFSDEGDVDVTYRADTALYIDKRLNA